MSTPLEDSTRGFCTQAWLVTLGELFAKPFRHAALDFRSETAVSRLIDPHEWGV